MNQRWELARYRSDYTHMHASSTACLDSQLSPYPVFAAFDSLFSICDYVRDYGFDELTSPSRVLGSRPRCQDVHRSLCRILVVFLHLYRRRTPLSS